MDFQRGLVKVAPCRHWAVTAFAGYAAFPLPDVVYNHITYRRRERAADIRRLFSQLEEQGIPVFNTGYFGKWDVHNWLSTHEALPHLPEMHQLGPKPTGDLARYSRFY